MPCGTRAQCGRRDEAGNDADEEGGGKIVIKIWGRKTSANVQKVMWAIGEIGRIHSV
jgi:hypothetical protein